MTRGIVLTSFAAVAALVLTVPSQVFAHASAGPVPSRYSGSIRVGQKTYSAVPYVRYGNSSYVNVNKLLAILNDDGLAATQTGRDVSAAWLGQYLPGTHMKLASGAVVRAGSFTINGNTYADLSAVAQLMRSRLSFAPANGVLTVQPIGSKAGKNVTNLPAGRTSIVSAITKPAISSAPSSPPNTLLGGVTWSSFQGQAVPTISFAGKKYMGVWYITNALSQLGYTVSFKDGVMDLRNLPTVVQDGILKDNGSSMPTTLIRIGNRWYAPLSALVEGLRLAASVDTNGNVVVDKLPMPVRATVPSMTGNFTILLQTPGNKIFSSNSVSTTATSPRDKVFLLLQNGSLMSQTISGSGSETVVSVPGTQAQVMGYLSSSGSWIGMGTTVNAASSVITLPTAMSFGAIAGRILPATGQEFSSDASVTFRDVVTQQNITIPLSANGRYSANLPYGVYEIWSVTNQKQTMFIGSRFVVNSATETLGTVKFPELPTNGRVTSRNFIVVSQAANIPPSLLVNIASTLRYSYSYDVGQLGLSARLPIVVMVFDSESEFTQHFLDEAYNPAVSGLYGQDAQAVTEGPQYIAVNAQGMSFDSDINIMAHELTHALLAANYGVLPSWINEGLAWHQGLSAQLGDSPLPIIRQSLWRQLWLSPMAAAQSGQLYPLLTASSVATKYNVEAQDNFAVEQLINKGGIEQLLKFIGDIGTVGQRNAFASIYHQSETSFAASVDAELKSEAGGGSAIQVTIGALASAPGELFVSNPSGETYVFSGVQPGSTYTFTLSQNGQVKASNGLNLIASTQSSSDGHWDIGTQVGTTQSFFSINPTFGLDYLESTNTFEGKSNVAKTSISTVMPLGLKLISIASPASATVLTPEP